jgi:hypothetical protein
MFPPNNMRAAFCTLALAASPLGAADPPPVSPEENPLVLPPMEVRGQFEAEGWVLARIDHTEFLSQLSAEQTRVLIDDFVIFQEFVRAKYPEAALPADDPVTVVLCNNAKEYRNFAGDRRYFVATLPESERFILIDVNRVPAFEDPIDSLIRLMRMSWMDVAYQRIPPGKYPLWRELGTKNLLAAIQIRDDARLEMGLPPFNPHMKGAQIAIPTGSGVRVPTFPTVSPQFGLNYGDLVPLETLFTVTRQSSKTAGRGLALSATAFMHQCLFSAKQRQLRTPYAKFISRLETGPYSEKLFLECFGKKTEDMDRLLRDYVFSPSIKYESRRCKFPPTPPFEVRKARPAEVLHLLRECQRLQAAAAARSR